MARMPRLAVAGQPHLVIQRSGADRPAFIDDTDRRANLDAVREVADRGPVAIHAHVLLDDAVMLLLTPHSADDLGRFMQRVSRRYVGGFRQRHGGSGALWSGRFQAAALEPERYLLAAMLLIEQAPMRAGLVATPTDWPWSSARHHTGRGASALITEHPVWWHTGNTPFEREARHEMELQRSLPVDRVAELLAAARRGWPLGSPAFVAATAGADDRQVRPKPRGRPRQATGGK